MFYLHLIFFFNYKTLKRKFLIGTSITWFSTSSHYSIVFTFYMLFFFFTFYYFAPRQEWRKTPQGRRKSEIAGAKALQCGCFHVCSQRHRSHLLLRTSKKRHLGDTRPILIDLLPWNASSDFFIISLCFFKKYHHEKAAW